MLIVDAHEDLAWNMLTFGRDYTRSVADTRKIERGELASLQNGDTLLGWPEYQHGHVAIIFATLFAAPLRSKVGDWETQVYGTVQQAHSLYTAQLDAYHRLADNYPDQFRLINTLEDLRTVLDHWERKELDLAEQEVLSQLEKEDNQSSGFEFNPGLKSNPSQSRTGHPVGLVVLMENAEGVRSPDELEEWWQRGVRLIGPAWAGTRFCGGTREPGSLTSEGYALLDSMAELGFTLDLSHMDEQSVLQALDYYSGTIVASHANARSKLQLLKGSESNRFLSDRVISGLLERDGVIGIVPYNNFLKWGWKPEDGRQSVTLQNVVTQIDYICQMAGDARHVGLGSDFDGGFGLQHVPAEIDSIVDLQKIAGILRQKGYPENDIAAILGGNWLTVLRHTLPEIV